MKFSLRNVRVYQNGSFVRSNVSVQDGSFSLTDEVSSSAPVIDGTSLAILPGLTDVHVHLREPGFSYKETIRTGTMAAAHGGYTQVCPMPNLNPTPDDLDSLNIERGIIERDAVIRALPYGTITRGEKGGTLSDLEAMAPYVCAFSDDGHGVQNDDMMRAAMLKARSLDRMITAHCEVNSLLRGGCIHDGEFARAHGYPGICSESEWGQIARDLELAEETGCAYHVCHISAKESVDVIRKAKARGVNVTCETGPHYLVMNDSMLQEDGRFKMNPPIRAEEDRQALLAGILDGTVDMIATDHAPHSAEEKSRGLLKSAMGIVGLETSFPLLYTNLVLKGVLDMKRLMELMHYTPCRRFRLPELYREGAPADFTIFDLDNEYAIDPDTFLSMGRATPFAGWKVRGKCLMTVCEGRIAWCDPALGLTE